MTISSSPAVSVDIPSEKADKHLTTAEITSGSSDDDVPATAPDPRSTVPLSWKIMSVFMVCLIGFGSSWSANLTSAMKSTLKKELSINNTQFALLEASEDFMVTALMLVSGIVTDRIGGAGAMLYGNLLYTVGTILVAGSASARSYKFMIFGRVVTALGDIATQVAQYKIFSSWFPPSAGFATTLGLELGIGRIGGFVGTSTANIIAKRTGNFAWVFWVAVFINIFTCLTTLVFYKFTQVANRKFHSNPDPATGEILTEKNKKVEIKKILELPWTFWCIMGFSMVQTSCAIVYTSNATELAEQRFSTSSINAGWYSALAQYAGFFITPFLGAGLDLYGNRLSVMTVCGLGMLLSMALVNWAPTPAGTAASFGVFAIFKTLGPTTIIDSIRTSMWHSGVFGSAYAIKITLNNATNILVRVITGVIQDADSNSYEHVTIVYVFLALASVLASTTLLICSTFFSADLKILQYTRRQRIANGDYINLRRVRFETVFASRNRRIGGVMMGFLLIWVLGSWAAYFWGVATGNND